MTQHPADTHDLIRVRQARENNLQGVDADIPKRRITAFTGVSGSGKSSLVFGTIAAESQRLINETYTSFVQSFMPSMPRPDVEVLENLSAAIVVDQERMGANSRSTVGTATDAYSLLRVLYSRYSTPSAGGAGAYSFNLGEGACATCEGFGTEASIDLDELLDWDKTLAEGAITAPNFAPDSWLWQTLTAGTEPDLQVKLKDMPKDMLERMLYAEPGKVKLNGANMSYSGLITRIKSNYIHSGREIKQAHIRDWIERISTTAPCAACNGSRLSEKARASKIAGLGIAQMTAMQVTDLHAELVKLVIEDAAPLLANLRAILTSMIQIGLGYISLDRPAGTLSGGESQRVKMIRHLGSALSDVTYVFDEPTVGLHPHDIQRMNHLLRDLRDKGNTVLVVEHKPEVIKIADHVIDLGPGAGLHGGNISYAGNLEGLLASDTVTGRHFSARVPMKQNVRSGKDPLQIRAASTHNLKNIDVDIPRGVLCAITGVAGSGKSTLIHSTISKREDVAVVDQSAIRGSRRSNPATYTSILDPIRAAFAKANSVKPALFSANSEGACPNCNGVGFTYTDLATMAGVQLRCEVCEGKRYTAKVLEYRLDGLNIAEVLNLSIEQAFEQLKVPKAKAMLERLNQVGLGYIKLGQPLNTLSGGERQRLKLAINLGKGQGTYILDEPTTGLHMADVDRLLGLLDEMVDEGNTVIVIEHHLAVVAHADWVIDLGPGAGHDGGSIVFEGTPAQLAGSGTLTGQHLAEYTAG
ncbi:daunorubicin resistance protein DrrC [Arthrobacter sp. MYb211]|uniref:ATP-binding cassette domain-containing protein n=1 Tax=unclassified Arthrobacter TaxID=235627 RepID=UPI000CFD9C54|nr:MULTISPECIES: excinuclease ABC subunit UvrA [unclassified Arthrobacter]PRA13983.1 daunorubicin resistance protein DrrC [Arthrobacter sp. MYb221]PRC09354.1 daunorubicin resistance protein DrrC [Arthrobacter sp. MYb211]